MEFSSRVSKFEKEAEKRKRMAKEKIRKEEVARRRQEKVEKERHEVALRRKEESERQQEEEEKKQREENRLTGGVKFEKAFKAVLVEGEDDKVVLPQSILEDLMGQNALDHGPMLFRIWTFTNSSSMPKATHCGVREFTADEGTVQVPRKVLDSLEILHLFEERSSSPVHPDKSDGINNVKLSKSSYPNCAEGVEVTLKYVLLPKVTSTRIQPMLNLFSQVGPVKDVLEENLRCHSTLSVGDVLTVYYRGAKHKLIVREICLDSDDDSTLEDGEKNNENEKIVRGGSLINTDVVVDIDISQEYLRHNTEKETAVAIQKENDPSQVVRGRRLGSSQPTAGENEKNETFVAPLPTTNEIDDEPLGSDNNAVTCKIKTPQGKTFTRRFLKTRPLRQLFSFVRLMLLESQVALPLENEHIQLMIRQPAKKFSETDSSNDEATFLSSGIESKNEMFFVSYVQNE